MSKTRRAALIAAFAVTASLGACASGAKDASPTPSPTDAVPFVSERDVMGLLSNDDLPEGMELERYDSINGIGDLASRVFASDFIVGVEPVGCSDLAGSYYLVRESERAMPSIDTVTFLFDVGAIGEAASLPSIQVAARLFATDSDASAYLDELEGIATECSDGLVAKYSEGDPWTASEIAIERNLSGFPSGMRTLEIDLYAVGYNIPFSEVMFQYGNAVVAATDISDIDSLFVTPRDLQDIMRTVAERLLERT
jgi:hypothetical protein